MNTIRTDTWLLSLPSDWTENGQTKEGSLYFESADGEKGLYVSTWNLGEEDSRSPQEVADAFTATDLRSLHEMDGYAWQTVDEKTNDLRNLFVIMVDSVAYEKSYRIVGKVLARPPIVVRASFHDYACTDYAESQERFAPIIESLCFYEPEV